MEEEDEQRGAVVEEDGQQHDGRRAEQPSPRRPTRRSVRPERQGNEGSVSATSAKVVSGAVEPGQWSGQKRRLQSQSPAKRRGGNSQPRRGGIGRMAPPVSVGRTSSGSFLSAAGYAERPDSRRTTQHGADRSCGISTCLQHQLGVQQHQHQFPSQRQHQLQCQVQYRLQYQRQSQVRCQLQCQL